MIKKIKNISKYSLEFNPNILEETFKGQVVLTKEEMQAFKGLCAHPFKFSVMQEIYEKYGIITAAVDKYVDFIIGSGIKINSKDPRAKLVIEECFKDVNMDHIMRGWIKQALIKGNSPLEISASKGKIDQIKLLNADTIFKRRDKTGTLLGYKQKMSYNDPGTDFAINEIAYLTFNVPNDAAYGLGIIYPCLSIINNILGCEKDMHMLIRRKANTPIHVQLGNYDKEDIPTPEEVANFGTKLEYLTNKQEWATGPNVNFKTIDFGNIAGKFDFVLTYDRLSLFHALQIPEVIMGTGTVSQGLAKEQKDAWLRTIASKQEEVEKVMEQDICKVILDNNKIKSPVDIEWGQPSRDETNERITQITALLALFNLNPELSAALQNELAMLMKLEIKPILPQDEKAKEETQPQPVLPGTKQKMMSIVYEGVTNGNQLKCGKCNRLGPAKEISRLVAYECTFCNSINNILDVGLKEWVGFRYNEFIKNIEQFIKKDPYTQLKATTELEKEAGMLSEPQITKLKSVLITSFREGASIRDIHKEILTKVKPKDLLEIKDDKIVTNEAGEQVIKLSAANRSIAIARTETIRAAAEGALKSYQDNGIEKVTYLSSVSERTCDICESLNGQIMSIAQAQGTIPVHTNCRCTFTPILGE